MNSSLKKAQDYVDKFNKNCKNNYRCYGIQGPTGPVAPITLSTQYIFKFENSKQF